MGDSACLMHAFSYASAIPNESKQGNPMHALGESISFGRFMSESLDWDKWSTFSHNRYVEEAERYAQKGSVAQKKAFFEAHYKRIAAKKAAALLEQADTPPTQPDVNPSPDFANQEEVLENSVDSVVNTSVSVSETVEQVVVEEVADMEEAENDTTVEGPGTPVATEKEPSNQLDNGETQETASGSEISETSNYTEKPLLKVKKSSSSKVDDDDVASVTSKKKSAFSSFKSSLYSKNSRAPSSPSWHNNHLHVDKENNSTLDLNEMRSTPKSLSNLINYTPAKEPHRVPPPPPPYRKDSSKVIPTTGEASKTCATPKSLSTLINYTPAKEPHRVPPPPPLLKKESSQVASTVGEASKKCATPFKTPLATSNGASKRPTTTPSSESRRIKTPIHPSASGSKTTGPKWNILSSVCSKSFTACRNKLQSPTLSTPFLLRTEERAARRKQKLEEKFNAKDVQKVQQQTTLKEKAEIELRKIQQSFCFKARPLPEFYKERETVKNHTDKTPVTDPQLPKNVKVSCPSSTKGIASKPASASLAKNDTGKKIAEKKSSRKPTKFSYLAKK